MIMVTDKRVKITSMTPGGNKHQQECCRSASRSASGLGSLDSVSNDFVALALVLKPCNATHMGV